MCQPKVSPVSSSGSLQHDSSSSSTGVTKAPIILKSQQTRPLYIDILCFLLPALAFPFTDVSPIYMTGIARIISTHAFMALHFLSVDKDNYTNKLSQNQVQRERKDYLVGTILHMWAQLALQLLFPGMFFSPNSYDNIANCAWNTFLTHVCLVEPLYYAVHRWLHVPEQMRAMHGHHHMSVNTVPSTSLVQNFTEHFIYIATFGPAMIFPYFLAGSQHWSSIMAYLVLFDIVNAYGHTNFKCRHWIWESVWSPLRYAFYTPEFHLGHHHYYNCNYGLFMPLWDHLFNTYREYKKNEPAPLPQKQQDFVFLGHNGGLGHLITIPEVSVYNVYDSYWMSGLPLKIELLFVNAIFALCRLLMDSYRVSRYVLDGRLIGRVVCIVRSPIDYILPERYPLINKELIETIRREYRQYGTLKFGLGNCNKMKQLNDGGRLIRELIAADPELSAVGVRVWTGDTLTAASVYQQLLALPDIVQKGVFYIGANGKIGTAVCQKLVQRGIKIRIFSKFEGFQHELVSYTQDLGEMHEHKYTLIGKLLKASTYKGVVEYRPTSEGGRPVHRYLLDYTVPFMPLTHKTHPHVHHLQVGVLNVTDGHLLKGYYDICFGIPQNHIYPCHMGCLINLLDDRQTDEIGEVDLQAMDDIWARATALGLVNKTVDVAMG